MITALEVQHTDHGGLGLTYLSPEKIKWKEKTGESLRIVRFLRDTPKNCTTQYHSGKDFCNVSWDSYMLFDSNFIPKKIMSKTKIVTREKNVATTNFRGRIIKRWHINLPIV